MRHLKRLGLGLAILGIIVIAAAAVAGLAWLTINYPWFTAPLFVLAVAYVLGDILYDEFFG